MSNASDAPSFSPVGQEDAFKGHSLIRLVIFVIAIGLVFVVSYQFVGAGYGTAEQYGTILSTDDLVAFVDKQPTELQGCVREKLLSVAQSRPVRLLDTMDLESGCKLQAAAQEHRRALGGA